MQSVVRTAVAHRQLAHVDMTAADSPDVKASYGMSTATHVLGCAAVAVPFTRMGVDMSTCGAFATVLSLSRPCG